MKAFPSSPGRPYIRTPFAALRSLTPAFPALPDSFPLNVGGIGVTGTYAANVLVKDCDLVIGVGTRFNDFVTGSKWVLFQNPKIKVLAINTSEFHAEKLDAILGLMEFSSRMKDYYDIYYLANKFDFDGKTLTEAMEKTFANRNRSFTVEQFDRMISFSADAAMQKKWAAFCKKINTASSFNIVLETIRTFLLPSYQSAVQGKEFTKTWETRKQEWL